MLSVLNRAELGKAQDIRPAANAGERHGIGLVNTRQRLAAQYGEAAAITAHPLPDGYRVDIEIPALPVGEAP